MGRLEESVARIERLPRMEDPESGHEQLEIDWVDELFPGADEIYERNHER
jgi:hypothetical protein